jgi:hypothetical protein
MAYYFLTLAILLIAIETYFLIRYHRWFHNAYFLLVQWRQFGADLAKLYPAQYAELNDHRSDGSRWDMRKIKKAADSLANVDKM